MTSLWAAITSKRRLGHPNRLYFLNPECASIPWLLYLKNVPVENFQAQSVSPKNSLFRQFPCTHINKCCGLVCPQFWCHWLPWYLVWTVIPTSFQGKAWSWPGVNRLASRSFQSQVAQIRAHKNRLFWGVLFAKNRFSWPSGQLLSLACHTYSESYWSDC